MPKPIDLAQRRPSLDPPPARPEETTQERRTRQLAFLAELAELNMCAARAAGARIEAADPETDQADAATLSLARATRAVTNIINIENRIADGEQASPLQPGDRRRTLLREALHPLTKDLDPPRRAALRRRIDQAIDDALLTELDDEMPLGDVAIIIAKSVGLHLDLATVTDELLAVRPRPANSPNPFERHPDDQAFEFARAPP